MDVFKLSLSLVFNFFLFTDEFVNSFVFLKLIKTINTNKFIQPVR